MPLLELVLIIGLSYISLAVNEEVIQLSSLDVISKSPYKKTNQLLGNDSNYM